MVYPVPKRMSLRFGEWFACWRQSDGWVGRDGWVVADGCCHGSIARHLIFPKFHLKNVCILGVFWSRDCEFDTLAA